MTSLEQLRVERQLSQKQLAEMSGVSQATISRHEAKVQPIKFETAKLIANALKVKVEQLFEKHQITHRGRPPQTGVDLKKESRARETHCEKCYLIHSVYIDCTN